MEHSTAPSIGASRDQRDLVSGILVFIIADLVVFAMLFTGFMVDRAKEVAVFNRSANTLDYHLGLLIVVEHPPTVLALHRRVGRGHRGGHDDEPPFRWCGWVA